MNYQAAKQIIIDTERAGQRLDNFLISQLKGLPKSRIYRMIRGGEVRINGKRVKPTTRLQADDQVRIPPFKTEFTPQDPLPHQAIQGLEERIIYEDDALIVINKPAGLAVHGGSGIQAGLIERIRCLRPRAKTLELVHRLDKATSGCLLIAKKRSALRELHQLFGQQAIHKLYLAIVQGAWPVELTVIDHALRKNTLRSGERMVVLDAQGKAAMTQFAVLAQQPQASLIKIRPQTGRTHQIRVHTQSADHPIAGDEKYGEAAFNQRMAQLGCKHLCLHAYQLKFPLPGSGYEVTLRAPLPTHFTQLLTQLGLIYDCSTLTD
ncbi:MAG: RluA family pseudouridine synthase [Legionellales bacterium]|nr:RluA family pseudouridine synthase [Legionellales bacterium]